MSFEPNDMMMDLFRSEVESHAESLTSSLLSLEQDPANESALEQMMRSAHSIKGAAKIVRVAPAAEIAHVMEDCFVAAQNEQLVLTSADIDVLLRGVDLMTSVANATKESDTDWNSFSCDVEEVSQALQAVLNGEVTKAPPTAERSSKPPNPNDHIASRFSTWSLGAFFVRMTIDSLALGPEI
jgi:two-component system sensor histidine kinase and response regulator WspE